MPGTTSQAAEHRAGAGQSSKRLFEIGIVFRGLENFAHGDIAFAERIVPCRKKSGCLFPVGIVLEDALPSGAGIRHSDPDQGRTDRCGPLVESAPWRKPL